MAKKPGPPKEFPETVLARLPDGTKANLKAQLEPGETEGQFVRDAIMERINKRARRRTKGRAHASSEISGHPHDDK